MVLYHCVLPKDLYYSLIDMYPLYKAGSFWVYAILVLIAVFLDTVPVYNHHFFCLLGGCIGDLVNDSIHAEDVDLK